MDIKTPKDISADGEGYIKGTTVEKSNFHGIAPVVGADLYYDVTNDFALVGAFRVEGYTEH